MRASGPVLRSNNSWIVTGYAEAFAALKSPEGRSGFIGRLYSELLPVGAAREEMRHRINFLDPPDHGRVRSLVAKAFTPRRVSSLAPYLRRIGGDLLAPLAGDEPVDLLEAFAHQVPALVISELLGVPPDDRDRLTDLSHDVSALLGLGGLDEVKMARALAAAEEMHAYLRALLEERRRTPGHDLLSALLETEENDERLSESELLSLAATLYSAGHRTTRDLFSNGLAVLLEDRERVRRVAAGELPIAAVVEEMLRFETPTHYVARMFERSVRLGDVDIPAGEPVAVILAAANRDELAFERADEFRPERWTADPSPPPPLSFAFGPHFCLGASLARLETATMLEVLLATFPDIALSGEPIRWRHSGLFRGVERLTVVPGSAAA